MSKMWIHVAKLSIATLVVSLLSGCGDSNPAEESSATEKATPSAGGWPASLAQFRFHWSAEPGIDITTGPAMIVRAYLESYDVAEMTSDPNNVYPGFDRATPENQPRVGNYEYQLIGIRPFSLPVPEAGNKAAAAQFGYEAFHFLELTPSANGFRAIVCSGSYANFVKSDTREGQFVSVAADPNTAQPRRPGFTGVYAHQIELAKGDPRVGSDAPPGPSVPQAGPEPAPNNDVFGDWFITGAGLSHWGPVNGPNPLRPDLDDRCARAMPQGQAERLQILTGFKDQPPAHGEAVPGWPKNAS